MNNKKIPNRGFALISALVIIATVITFITFSNISFARTPIVNSDYSQKDLKHAETKIDAAFAYLETYQGSNKLALTGNELTALIDNYDLDQVLGLPVENVNVVFRDNKFAASATVDLENISGIAYFEGTIHVQNTTELTLQFDTIIANNLRLQGLALQLVTNQAYDLISSQLEQTVIFNIPIQEIKINNGEIIFIAETEKQQ